MSADVHTEPTVVVPAGDIDELLGPSAGRFFGSGYKRVGQQISRLGWVPLGSGERSGRRQVVGEATVVYPPDWSRKTGSPRLVPHLSSIDALALALRLVEAFLADGYGLDPAEVSRAWLRRYVMRSGAQPQLDLDDVGLSITELGSAPSELTAGWRNTQFDCVIGMIRVRCDVEHEPPVTGRSTATEQVRLPAATYHRGGYRDRVYRITDVAVDPGARSTTAIATVTGAPQRRREPVGSVGEPVGEAGLGGAYQPSLTMIDSMIVLAQLAQAVLYALDGLSRGGTNTLWMRKIDMTRSGPHQPIDGAVPCSTRIDRGSVVDLGGARWRVCSMSGSYGDTRVRYAVGHQLP